MFGWGDSENAYQQAYDTNSGEPNQAKLSHEVVAGGAAFAAFKVFEDRQRSEGKPVSHQFAKEALVGIAGAEVDRLFETKGMDFIDKERAQHQAKRQVEEMYDSHYGQNDQYDPNMPPPQPIQQYGNY